MNLDRRLLRQSRRAARSGCRAGRQATAVRIELALAVGLGWLAGILLVLQAGSLSRLVSLVFLEGLSLGQAHGLFLALLLFSLARAGASWGAEVTAHRVAARVKTELRQRLSAHLLALGPAYAQGERSGELANTATEGVEALDAYLSQYLPQLALAVLVPLTILAFAFRFDLLSGLVLLFTAPLIPIFMILIGNLADALTRRQWTSLSRMSAHFLDMLGGLTTLKLLGRSRDQIETIAGISEAFRRTTLGVLRVAFLSALVMELVATLSTAVVAVEVGLRLLYGRLAFEQAFFILLLAPEFYLPLRLLGTRFHAGMAGLAAARRIFEVLETPPPKPVPAIAQQGEATQVETSRDGLPIRFADVRYAYAGGERPALKGLSFQVAPGQKAALVGPSGAGKSTVAYLLLRFIEPDGGQISVGGIPLPHIPVPAWRRQVAWVPQNPYLFHTSVAENIRLARPEASHAAVVRAARQAGAHDFIQALPQGYETPVGERGMRLSAGQAQRVALARAFLKDAPLLILDEATSNLDPEHEAALQATLEGLMHGRTVLVIAHRLSSVYRADQILVVADGKLVAAGTHTALMEEDGLYRRMVDAYGGLDGWMAGRLDDWKDEREEQSSSHPVFQPSSLPAIQPSSLPTFQPSNHPTSQPSNHPTIQPSSLPILYRLLRLAAPFKARIALAALLGFATIASGIGLMAASATIIARAALHPSIADLQVAIVGVRFFGIARGVFRYLERYVSHQVTFRLLARLRVWFYQALEPLAPARLMQYKSGDILTRVVADVETLQHVYVRVIAPPLVAVLVVCMMWLWMRSYAAGLALTLLIFLALVGLGLPLLTQRLGREPGRRLVAARSELNVALVDGVQGVADLLACGAEARHQERVARLNDELAGLQRRMAGIGGLHTALTGLLTNLAALAVLAVAIPLVSGARLDGVTLALLALAAMSSFEAVAPLPLAFQYLGNSLEAARRLFELVDAQPAVHDPPAPSPLPQDYGLSVKEIGFHYAKSEPPALDGVSFVLPQGGSLAVVGPSGAGKSTLVNLLLRFWDYETGQIQLGGHELRAYQQEDLRRMFGVVSQHTYLFNATLRDNLLMARPQASQAELVRAAQHAQLHEFIESLPEGYNTYIGEQGLKLSGGQRQRLAIARALLQDAPILILDEPTANLDAMTEREVMQTMRALMAGRTTLLITHRLVDLEAVDEILVLRTGRVVERGTHQELWQMGGLYRRMGELQRQVLADSMDTEAQIIFDQDPA
jgi:ATP-binding cassette subfamily C protein CydCD